MTRTYSRKGVGTPPLVFVHGFGCARDDWDEQVLDFTPRHETVAIDLAGHGDAPATPDHGRIETHGHDVAALLRSLDLPPAVLVGHSMGCRVILDAAARVPDRVRAVVLVDGSRREPGSTAHLGRTEALERLGYREFIGPLFKAMFTPAYDERRVDAVVRRAMDCHPDIAAPLFLDIGRYDAERFDEVLNRIEVPLMAIQSTRIDPDGSHGSLRRGDSMPYLEHLRTMKPQARIEIIPDTGHFPHRERPADTNALIRSFLEQLR